MYVCGCVCVLASSFSSGDSRDSARPATRHRGPFGSFTRAATALVPTSSGTVDSVPTPAAACLTTPPLLRWPSAAQPADCYSELWWWSTRVSAITTAPTHRTLTLLFGDTGLDSLITCQTSLTDSSSLKLATHVERTLRETWCITRWIQIGILNGLWKRKWHCRFKKKKTVIECVGWILIFTHILCLHLFTTPAPWKANILVFLSLSKMQMIQIKLYYIALFKTEVAKCFTARRKGK